MSLWSGGFRCVACWLCVDRIVGNVQDMLLPCVGDKVTHRDDDGKPFEGKLTDRIFAYESPAGIDVDGKVTVTLWMDRTVVH
jgi:hypothetical protein